MYINFYLGMAFIALFLVWWYNKNGRPRYQMQVLSQKFVGHIATCETCGALLSWQAYDVYDGYIYCSICKQKTFVNFDKNYDGIVKEQESK